MIMPLKNQIPRQAATVGVFYSRWGQVGLRPGADYLFLPLSSHLQIMLAIMPAMTEERNAMISFKQSPPSVPV